MITDPELDQWSELFRSQPQVEPAEIVARAKKAVRRFRLWIYTEIAVTVAAILFAIWMHQRAVAVLVVVSIVAAWLFRLFNDWNDFTGVATATGSYSNILLRRLRSNKRAAEFGAVLYFVLLPIVSALAFRELNLTLREYVLLPSSIFFAIGTVVFYVCLFRYCRKLKNQISELSKLEDEFAGDIAGPPPQAVAAIFVQAINHFTQQIKKKLRAY